MPDLPRADVEIIAPQADEPLRPGVVPPAPAELRAALLEACTAAAGGTAQCVEPSTGEPAAAVSVVFRAPNHARVEVSARRGDAPFGTRDLTFEPSHAHVERYRTIGYAAGTLVSEYLTELAERERASTAPAAATTAAPATTSTSPDSAPAIPAAASRAGEKSARREDEPDDDTPGIPRELPLASIDLGVVHGTAFEGGAMRTGGAIRGAFHFGAPFVTASFAYSVRAKRDGEPSASFVVASAGAGYLVPFSVFQAGGRVEAVVERLASEGETPSGRSGSAARFLGGARVGADFAWLPLPSFGLVLSGDASFRAAPTELIVEGQTVATVPVLDFTGLAGLRLSVR